MKLSITMWQNFYFFILYCVLSNILVLSNESYIAPAEVEARNYIEFLNNKTIEHEQRLNFATWDYETNITATTLQTMLDVQAEVAAENKQLWNRTIQYDWKNFDDPDLKRQFLLYSTLGTDALPKEKLSVYSETLTKMEEIYATTTVCSYFNQSKCDLALDPEITEILAKSQDPDELAYIWKQWYEKVGRPCKPLYEEYVNLSNEAAHLNNFTDTTAEWLDEFDDVNIRDKFIELWEEIRPFYLELHAYVRYRLRQKYDDIIPENGPIPAHLLGNMWAQTWENIYSFTQPFPGREQDHIDDIMKKQNYTVEKIFRTAEEFFKSINLTELRPEFWNGSMLVKPKDRSVVCHGSAWDFYNNKDYRIKMCTQINLVDFLVAHHEMGHIEYFMQYKDQPSIYRNGANSGFHEAIGDLISLSVESRKHLAAIGLSTSSTNDYEDIINNQYQICLEKLPFLPFSLSLELWRWQVFEGSITPDTYNSNWWKLRREFQGVIPPVKRPKSDFDPGAKMHIVFNVPYIRYFVSFIIQFQFHQALCEISGQYGPDQPLHNCDIYNNPKAGNALKKMLQMGASKPWPDAFEVLTGQREMNASSLLEYFKPLHEWLKKENKKNCVPIGW